jgi:hypothetical protein
MKEHRKSLDAIREILDRLDEFDYFDEIAPKDFDPMDKIEKVIGTLSTVEHWVYRSVVRAETDVLNERKRKEI